LAVFYYKYRNAQVTITDLSAGGQVLANAGSARGQGAELDFDWDASDWLNLFGSAAYLDAKYLSYPNGSIVVVDPATNTLVNASADLSGVRLPRAPKWTLIGGFTIKQQLSDAWAGRLSGNVRYTTNYDIYPAALGPLQFARQKAYGLVNLSADVKREFGGSVRSLSIGLYANNVTSTKYFYQKNTQATFGLSDIVAEPASYGVRTSITF
jgi:iron complex outermembrane receptor protein